MTQVTSRFTWLIVSAGLVVLAPLFASDGPHYRRFASVTGPSTVSANTVASPLPDWSVVAEQPSFLGRSVASAGDVNGDGYDDIIAGAPTYESSTLGGAAMVYHGSPSGPSLVPDWLVTGHAPNLQFGLSVAGAGDVNGDGYDDVIVGAPYDQTGRAHLFLGSAEGLSTAAAWTGIGPDLPSAPRSFGSSVGAAGDINGDGYDDIVVGDPANESHVYYGGAVFVYHGSGSGLPVWPDWEYYAAEQNARLGWAVSTAGDIDADGFDDVIVGAPRYRVGSNDRGRVFVFHGTSAGLPSVPTRVIDGEESTLEPLDRWGLGFDLAAAGDVNDDGFDDVVLGDREWADTHSNEGAAYLYLGSPWGLDPSPVWTIEGNEDEVRIGSIVGGAGDVDSDGIDDLLAGMDYSSTSNPRYVAVYPGADPQPSTTYEWSAQADSGEAVGTDAAGAGDVNGDGAEDIIVGDFAFGPGAVFVYFGCEDLDGDDLCAQDDCDDTNPNCTTDCTDLDGDGFCLPVDCDDFRPACASDCTDDDHDFICGEIDCDDLNPSCAEDCASDADHDGVTDCRDNCPTVANADQLDSDLDGHGDACDCPDVDDDFDGVCDSVDNCPGVTNPGQADLDGDGLGDVCDPCAPVPGVGTDSDGDGVCDVVDICPSEPFLGADSSIKLSGDDQVIEYDASPSGEWASYTKVEDPELSTLVGLSTELGERFQLNGELAWGRTVEWFAVAGDTGRMLYMAFEVGTGYQLFKVDTPGAAGEALLPVPSYRPKGLTADGEYLVARFLDTEYRGLSSIPSAGGEITHHFQVYVHSDEWSYALRDFSPKGNSITYITAYDVGGPVLYRHYREVLAGGLGVSGIGDTDFHFADDGTWMLFAGWYVSHPVHGVTQFFLPSSGDELRGYDVGTTPVEGSVRIAFALVAGSGDPLESGLFQVSVEGGPALRLAPNQPELVEVSPDGLHVVFDDDQTDLQLDLYSVPTMGGDVVRLTHAPPPGGDVLDYQLSPDGQWLVYRADQGISGTVELFAVPVAGGTPHRLNPPLSSGQAVEETHLITPDASTVIYLADQDQPGRVELYAVPIEGGASVKLSRPLPPGGAIRDLRMAEDGSLLLYLGEHGIVGSYELHARVLDVDGDNVHRACDCAPADGEVWAVPGPVPDLQLDHQGGLGGTTTLSWNPPTAPGGTAVVYDVLRSDVPYGFDPASPAYEVIETSLAETLAEDEVDPPAVFYYRIRPSNACGEGPIGE